MTEGRPFEVKFEVRDYELDSQRIVNNSRYLQYLEHARHKYLITKGLNFNEENQKGFAMVIYRLEIDYKNSLKPNSEFVVQSSISRESKLRFIFHQEIHTYNKIIAKAKVFCTCLNTKTNRPEIPPHMESLLYDV